MARKSKKNVHAQALSKLGARKGGIIRAARLTAEERKAIARKAGLASGKARRKKK